MFVPCSTHRNLFAPVFLVSHYKKHCPLFLDGCGWKTHHSEGGKTSNASAWTRAEGDLCLDRQIRARSNHLELWEPVYLLSGKISLSEVPQWLKNVLIVNLWESLISKNSRLFDHLLWDSIVQHRFFSSSIFAWGIYSQEDISSPQEGDLDLLFSALPRHCYLLFYNTLHICISVFNDYLPH